MKLIPQNYSYIALKSYLSLIKTLYPIGSRLQRVEVALSNVAAKYGSCPGTSSPLHYSIVIVIVIVIIGRRGTAKHSRKNEKCQAYQAHSLTAVPNVVGNDGSSLKHGTAGGSFASFAFMLVTH